MWIRTARTDTPATRAVLWRLFEEVAGWTNWSAGAQPRGTRPGLRAPDARVDEAVSEDPRLRVSHELQALPCGGTRVVFSIRTDGPDAERPGAAMTADFPELLAAVKALAEQAEAGAP